MNQRDASIGKIQWRDLTVANASDVREFYEKVVGWTSEPVSMGDYDDHCMKSADGQVVAGICNAKGTNAGLPPLWIPYINVDNIEKSLTACEELGGEKITDVKSMGGDTYCLIRDPAGAVCALYCPE